MERKMGLFSERAFSNASSPHGYQSTGLCACWRRYGLFWPARRFIDIPFSLEFCYGLGDLAAGRGRHGANRTAADAGGQPRQPHGLLYGAGERVQPHRGVERVGQCLQSLRFGLPAGPEGGIQIHEQARRDVGAGGDGAGAAAAERVQNSGLGGGKHGQRPGGKAGRVGQRLLQASARILDAGQIFSARRNARHRIRGELHAAVHGEIVGQHGKANGLADLDIVLCQFVLGGLDVIGRDHHQHVHAIGFRGLRQADGLARGNGADVAVKRHAAGHCLPGEAQQNLALLEIERVEFARGAAGKKAVHPGRDLAVDHRLPGSIIDARVPAEGGHQGGHDAIEGVRHVFMVAGEGVGD